MEILNVSLPHVLTSLNKLALGGSSLVKEALHELHTKDKKIEHVENIMVSSSLTLYFILHVLICVHVLVRHITCTSCKCFFYSPIHLLVKKVL